MKYSYNWLKELSGVKWPAAKAAEFLTMHSFELEKFEEINFKDIVVGEILEIKKHPNADKLVVTKINIGSDSPLPIVCGADNIKTGDKVPVALVGAILPGMSAEGGSASGGEIKNVEIRGEKSFGMLCAEDELGLGKNHSGIMILPKNTKPGEPIEKCLPEKDSIFEMKVLPDRAHDAMSHVGVARELAALAGKKLDYDYGGLKLPNKKSKKIKVEISGGNLCPRYIGALLENIEIKDSPDWMKERLSSCGMRPINNVVDATNYVMLETGHPLHAFDLDKIETDKIVVRIAKINEKLELLDKTNLDLTENDLLITNGEKALGLAGIMGGRDSGIYETTKNIVVEAANFDSIGIRKSRTRHRLKTEASDRYEKGLDPNLSEIAMARVIEILEHTADAKLEGIADVYPKKINPWKIKLDLGYVNNLLGEKVPAKNVVKILTMLDIKVKNLKNIVECVIPTFRIDLKAQEDLIEEIGRIWGYDKIKPRPLIEAVTPPVVYEMGKLAQNIKEKLTVLGFNEIYNYSFYSKNDIKNCGLDPSIHYELANPMNPDQDYVRASLIPNILKNIRENLKHFSDVRIFEIGKTYRKIDKNTIEKNNLIITQVLEKEEKASNLFELKGSAAALLEILGISEIKFAPQGDSENSIWKNGYAAEIIADGKKIGFIGEINPGVREKYKISKSAAMAEINLDELIKLWVKVKNYKPLQKFPDITRDVSLIADSKNSSADMEKFIKAKGGELVLSVELFDIFQKDGKNSLAYRVTFGADRTLESEEADKAMEKIIFGLENELKLEVRK